jgi:hypothetical protein
VKVKDTGSRTFAGRVFPPEPFLAHFFFLVEKEEIELSYLECAEVAVGIYSGSQFNVIFHNLG